MGFDVDPAQLRQVGLLTQQAAADLRTGELTPTRSAHDQLLPSWAGVDQVQYKALADSVLTIGDTLVDRLDTVGSLLLSAETTYVAGQTRQSQNFGRINEALNG